MKYHTKFLLINYFFISLSISSQQSSADISSTNACLNCHSDMEYLPEDFHEEDAHLSAGISCTGCHGGNDQLEDAEESMSAEYGFIGIPIKSDIPSMCGKCHSSIEIMREYQPRISTDQVSQYYKSQHGIQLLQGDNNVASCVNCHTAHSIFKANDPRSTVYAINIPKTCEQCHSNSELMSQYGLKADQYKKYVNSVHGVSLLVNKDTGAPACNDCHGNHGAMPPEVKSISHVCGNCHIKNMEFFLQSEMGQNLEEIHACEECHNHHSIQEPTDAMLGSLEKSVCIDCHTEGDPGFKVSQTMYRSINNLKNDIDSVDNQLEEIQIIGMNDIDISFLLQEAKQILIESRTSIHSFDTSIVLSKTNKGEQIAQKALILTSNEFNEYNSRRTGFFYATIAFFILALGVFLKIRQSKKIN